MRAEVEHVWLTCCRMAEAGNTAAALAFVSTMLGAQRISRAEYMTLISRPMVDHPHPWLDWARNTIAISARDAF